MSIFTDVKDLAGGVKQSKQWYREQLQYGLEDYVGGFTVGLFETACTFFISGSHKDAYAFLLMIVVLLIKPTGFFGVQVKMKA